MSTYDRDFRVYRYLQKDFNYLENHLISGSDMVHTYLLMYLQFFCEKKLVPEINFVTRFQVLDLNPSPSDVPSR